MKKISCLALFFCVAGIVTNPVIADSSWCIESPSSPKYFHNFSPRAMAVDGNGYPHITYGGDHLYYAHYDGNIWHYETVDISPKVGELASLALDAGGKAYISYYDYTNSDLKYATNKSGAWITETVDDSYESNGKYSSLALDAGGNTHISYYDYTSSDLKYATNKSGAWVTETVESGRMYFASIALDVEGNARHVGIIHITRNQQGHR